MSEPAADPSGLDYPLPEAPTIGDGSAIAVAPGVHWLRMPMDGRIGSINVWCLNGADDRVVVDTGLRTEQTAAAWRAYFCKPTNSTPVSRVLVTHLHPDHSGMAGWLVKRHRAALLMSKLEYHILRSLAEDGAGEAPIEAIEFYRAAGWDDDALDSYRARFGGLGKMLYPLPRAFVSLRDGDTLSMAHQTWEVVIGRGHSPEHALLYCASLKLLISGDQVLPKISSNVSVQPQQPEDDPLTEWITTLAAIKLRVPDDVLVLPAHGMPFHGLYRRIDALIAGHEEGLKSLLAMLDEPRRAVDVFPALFKRQIGPELINPATGESLAHLACLKARGLVTRQRDSHGVDWWRATGATNR